MKKLVFAILFYSPGFLFSQTFEKMMTLNERTWSRTGIETSFGYVIAAASSEIGQTRSCKCNLMVLDHKGVQLDNKEFSENYLQEITDLWVINDSTIGALGFYSSGEDSALSIRCYWLNNKLETIQCTDLKTNIFYNKIIALVTDICDSYNGGIIFQMSYFSFDHKIREFFFIEYNNQGIILKTRQIPTYFPPLRASITQDKSNGYFVFHDDTRYNLDQDFTIYDSLVFDPNVNSEYPNYASIEDVIWENDSTLIMSIPQNGDNSYFYMGLSRTRRGAEVIEDKRYDWNELYEMAAYYNNFDTVGNYFYLAATTNFNGGSEFDEDETGIRIIKANKDFSVNWDKTYRHDANNFLYYIIGTRDGGCMVAGTRYDFTQPEQRLDLYLLKVDSLGNYNTVSVPEGQGINPNVTVYPNPGTTELIISFTQPAEESIFNLYSLSGQKVLSSRVTPNQNTICTAALPKGLYLWEWVTQNQVIERGKWVKE